MDVLNVVVHYPKTEEGRKRLAEAVAQANCNMLMYRVLHHPCPAWQKKKLLDELIADLREEEKLKNKQA